MTCPFLDCHGERAHPGPHLFEQPDIARFRREGSAAERRRIRKLVATVTGRAFRREVMAALEDPA